MYKKQYKDEEFDVVITLPGMIAARIAAVANWSQTQSKIPSGSSSAVSEDSSSPGTPIEEYRPLTTPLNLDYSSKVKYRSRDDTKVY